MICICCGSQEFSHQDVLWPQLVKEWELTPEEEMYINRQQGTHCVKCQSNLRSMALAKAIMSCFDFNGLLCDFVYFWEWIESLEINLAGQLHPFLSMIPGNKIVRFPEVDIQRLPYDNCRFDLVIHSDTLEHISDDVQALCECRRVLRPGRFCVFTVPILVGKMNRSRKGAPMSYHGDTSIRSEDYIVYTEYGADVWEKVIAAGFSECRIHSLEFPSALAVIGIR